MAKAPGRTYRYYTGETAPVWCFGAGESYVEFDLAFADESALPTELDTDGDAAAALDADDAAIKQGEAHTWKKTNQERRTWQSANQLAAEADLPRW